MTAIHATSSIALEFALPRGLFVARLTPSASAAASAPPVVAPTSHVNSLVRIAASPFSGGEVSLFPSNPKQQDALLSPNDCLAIRVSSEPATLVAAYLYTERVPNSLLLIRSLDHPEQPPIVIDFDQNKSQISTYIPKDKRGFCPAQERVIPSPDLLTPLNDLLGTVSQNTSQTSAPGELARALNTELTARSISIKMVGHIQNRGDVGVIDGWLGDPNSNNRLEGFSIEVDELPSGVQLVYTCSYFETDKKPQAGNQGQFIGSKGKAQAIRSVSFFLRGENANQYELFGEIAFSGGARVVLCANEELIAPGGYGYLVAMRPQIVPKPKYKADSDLEEDDGAWTEEDLKQLFGPRTQ